MQAIPPLEQFSRKVIAVKQSGLAVEWFVLLVFAVECRSRIALSIEWWQSKKADSGLEGRVPLIVADTLAPAGVLCIPAKALERYNFVHYYVQNNVHNRRFYEHQPNLCRTDRIYH